MSRIGKQQLTIPAGTDVTLTAGVITVKGPKGTLSREVKDTIDITINGSEITFAPKGTDPLAKALWGTYASYVKNMIAGVNTPFSKKLILEGVGFKMDVKGTNLEMALGFSHPVIVAIPEGLTVTTEKGAATISGIDKEQVGQFSASVRALKKPEPYKGKGFHYSDEVVRRKQGKKTA